MAVPTSKIRPDKKAHNFGKIGGYGWRAAYLPSGELEPEPEATSGYMQVHHEPKPDTSFRDYDKPKKGYEE